MINNKYGRLRIKLAKFLTFIFLLIIIVILAFNAYLRNNDVHFEEISFSRIWDVLFAQKELHERTRTINEMQFTSSSNASFDVYRNYIVKASRLGLQFYDESFNEEEFFPFFMNRPSIKMSDTYIAIGDTNGKKIKVFQGGKKTWSKLLDENILSFDISRNGMLIVVHEKSKYRTGLTAFNQHGEVKFSMGTAEDFLMFPSIQNSAQRVIINRLNVSNVGINSILQFTNFFGEGNRRLNIDNAFVTKIDYLNDGSIVVFTDNCVKMLDSDTNKLWEKQYSAVFSSDVLAGRFLVLATSLQYDYEGYILNKTRVQILDGQDLRASVDLPGRVKMMDTLGSTIALASTRTVNILDSRGNLIGQFESEQDITDIKMIDETKFLVVGVTRASVVEIN